MDQLNPVAATLDAELATLRSQISHLRHRRSLLTTTLLTSPRSHALLERAAANPAIPQRSLDRATKLLQSQSALYTTNIHRALAGITAFRVQDPDPHAVDGGRVLGLRIDVFTARAKRFESPYYVLLHRVPAADDGPEWKVHKHTLPPFIPLPALAAKHLPRGRGEKEQSLHRFARAVRAEVVLWRRRADDVEVLKGMRGEMEREGVREIREADVSCREVEMVFEDEAVARLRLGDDGRIEKVVVMDEVGDAGTGESLRAGRKRRRKMERAIRSGDGNLKGLFGRLQKRHGEQHAL